MNDETQPFREEGATWHRAAKVLDVTFPKRTIELVVIPYETTIDVNWNGEEFQETIARGAFDGIQRRPNRVPVNTDHNESLATTIGKALTFHPSRKEGLVAEIQIVKNELGDTALRLAADDMIGASAGFKPYERDGLQWVGKTSYRVVKAWLRHIAMTAIPAYEEARVLQVRAATARPLSAYPNRERWRQMEQERHLSAVIASDRALREAT